MKRKTLSIVVCTLLIAMLCLGGMTSVFADGDEPTNEKVTLTVTYNYWSGTFAGASKGEQILRTETDTIEYTKGEKITVESKATPRTTVYDSDGNPLSFVLSSDTANRGQLDWTPYNGGSASLPLSSFDADINGDAQVTFNYRTSMNPIWGWVVYGSLNDAGEFVSDRTEYSGGTTVDTGEGESVAPIWNWTNCVRAWKSFEATIPYDTGVYDLYGTAGMNNSSRIDASQYTVTEEEGAAKISGINSNYTDSLNGGRTDYYIYVTMKQFTTTVNFVNEETGEAIVAPVVSEKTNINTEYDLTQLAATEIEGYSITRVEGDVTGKLDSDKVITVYYAPVNNGDGGDDPDNNNTEPGNDPSDGNEGSGGDTVTPNNNNADPGDSNGSGTENNSSEKTAKGVQTGDENVLGAWLILTVMAAGTSVFILRRKVR